jgi:superfamily II DNA or RNA helicase
MSGYISISELSLKDRKEIKENLTVQNKKTRFKQSVKCYLVKKNKLYLPFNHYFIGFGEFPNNEVNIETNDEILFKNELFEEQKKVIDEALTLLYNSRSVILNLRTGFGKTILSINLICQFKFKCNLIISNISMVTKQFINSIIEFSNLKYFVSGRSDKISKKRLKSNEVDQINQANVIICSSIVLDRLILPDIGMLIVDECHKFCTQDRIISLLSISPKYCVFMTASMRNDAFRRVTEEFCGEKNIVIRKNDIEFEIFKIETGLNLLPRNKVENVWNVLLEKQSLSKVRNQIILNLLHDQLQDDSRKICILTPRVLQAEILHHLINKNEIKAEILCGGMKEYNDSRVLIGTVSKIGTGFDEKNCCNDFDGDRINCLIITSTNKSDILFTQMIGRGLRSSDLRVYYIIDKDYISFKHYRELLKWGKDNNANFDENYEFNCELEYSDIKIDGLDDGDEFFTEQELESMNVKFVSEDE